MFCVFCGKEISDDSEFCEFCKNRVGYQDQKTSEIQMPSGKKEVDWVLCLIMSILFGTFGVDRFIMGQVGIGILKLFTCGGCGIWWLIDLVLIATKYKFQGIEWIEK